LEDLYEGVKGGVVLHEYREKTTQLKKYTDVLRITFKRQSTRFSFIPNNNENNGN
jgi:hypothetical protein